MADFIEGIWPHNEHQHAGGSLSRGVNPGDFPTVSGIGSAKLNSP